MFLLLGATPDKLVAVDEREGHDEPSPLIDVMGG
jgi:hypothetical protein